jgi:branched-chain amino acid transport system permease protein
VCGGVMALASGVKLLMLKKSGRPLPSRTMGVAVVGGVLVLAGLIGALVLPGSIGAEVNLGDFRMIIYALLLILMMIFRPQGLFGVHEVWERATWGWLTRRFKKGGAA